MFYTGATLQCRTCTGNYVNSTQKPEIRTSTCCFVSNLATLNRRRKATVHHFSGADLARLGYSVWDATSDVNRKDPPHSVDDFRIVQFESCRGLEGWVVVAEHLDEFFRKKYETFSRKPHQQVSFLDDRATEAKCFAALWSMIPLTRAIDTLVITLKDKESIFAQAVSRVAVGLRDVVRVLR